MCDILSINANLCSTAEFLYVCECVCVYDLGEEKGSFGGNGLINSFHTMTSYESHVKMSECLVQKCMPF